MAQLSADALRELDGGQDRADRRRPSHRSFFDRLGDAPRVRRCDRAGSGVCRGRPRCCAYGRGERERRPIVDKLVAAANLSSYWYERMADKMTLAPIELA